MKEVLEVLRRYLQHWDPIGAIPGAIINGQAPTEYDCYAGPLYTLLAEGGSEDDVHKYLVQCLDHMGMRHIEIRDRSMAKYIHNYFNKSSGFRK
ncbi:hypothetical protein ACLVWU_08425 [Bdellovibrio sp. HCB290]|uniref:hypothetical protein n=1 Tax=Bdellovibrio sp. HCB290 TaxID=3394356 RepID=UPI0039B479BA